MLQRTIAQLAALLLTFGADAQPKTGKPGPSGVAPAYELKGFNLGAELNTVRLRSHPDGTGASFVCSNDRGVKEAPLAFSDLKLFETEHKFDAAAGAFRCGFYLREQERLFERWTE